MSGEASPSPASKFGMLTIAADVAGLEAALQAQARRLGEAQAAAAATTPASPARWRKAALLWPLFGQE